MSGGALTQQARERFKQEDIKEGKQKTLDEFEETKEDG